MAPGTLLLLTGSPGCGKTTVAPLVADRHEPSACLDLDWFFATLQRGAIEPWRPESHTQNRVVLHAAAEAVAAFAAGGYFTVGEGILYPFMLDLFAAACEPKAVRSTMQCCGHPLGSSNNACRIDAANQPHGEAGAHRLSTTCGHSSSAKVSASATEWTPGRAARTRWPTRSTPGWKPASSASSGRVA
jgi:hypothetical protein